MDGGFRERYRRRVVKERVLSTARGDWIRSKLELKRTELRVRQYFFFAEVSGVRKCLFDFYPRGERLNFFLEIKRVALGEECCWNDSVEGNMHF